MPGDLNASLPRAFRAAKVEFATAKNQARFVFHPKSLIANAMHQSSQPISKRSRFVNFLKVDKSRHLQAALFGLSLLFFFGENLPAQTAQLSGIINRYAEVTAIDYCNGILQVSDTTGFRKGASLLIFQMKGAVIDSANASTFGAILALNNAGKFERADIDSVAFGKVFLTHYLENQYDTPNGRVQVVTFPRFPAATITAPLRPKRWDGKTGGILALEIGGTLAMNAPINADSCGYRGGDNYIAPTNNCYFLFDENDYFYNYGNWRGAPKGEGIAEFMAGREFGRGAQANGGGGGNDHNSGGGGGGHFAAGGLGGNNDEPSTVGCHGYFPGLGGRKINGVGGRAFLGGGGGGGHTNNLTRSAGGNGGGIIVLLAGNIKGSQPMISANGAACARAAGDGGGGAGAGGTILAKVGSAVPAFALTANGGKGGDTRTPGEERCFGPGGGGAGGRILTNFQPVATATGGQPGIVFASNSPCKNTSVGATAGADGFIGNYTILPEGNAVIGSHGIIQQPENQVICAGDTAFFTCKSSGAGLDYQWQFLNNPTWQNFQNTADVLGATTSKLALANLPASPNPLAIRCLVSAGQSCFAEISDTAQLIVNQQPTAEFTAAGAAGQIAFSNLSQFAATFHWFFGDGFESTDFSPEHGYLVEGNYTVQLVAGNNCGTDTSTQILNIQLPPLAAFSAPDSVKNCGPAVVHFQNQSLRADVTSWQFPGGSPATSLATNPDVTYSNSGTYTATLIAANAAGADTFSQQIVVQAIYPPVANFTFAVDTNGLVLFQNQSTGGDNYAWFFGDNLTSTDANPTHQYTTNDTFTVTLQVLNDCGAAVLQQKIIVKTVGIPDVLAAELGVKFWPNPARDALFLEFAEGQNLPQLLRLLDLNGREIFSKNLIFKRLEKIDLTSLPGGPYFLGLIFSDKTGWLKFLKN